MGTAGIVAAAAQTRHPVTQALVSMTQTFIDTLVVCSVTGFIILGTGAWKSGASGAALTTAAFREGLPLWLHGDVIVALTLPLFAFTTILGNNYYAEKALEYLFGHGRFVPWYRLDLGLPDLSGLHAFPGDGVDVSGRVPGQHGPAQSDRPAGLERDRRSRDPRLFCRAAVAAGANDSSHQMAVPAGRRPLRADRGSGLGRRGPAVQQPPQQPHPAIPPSDPPDGNLAPRHPHGQRPDAGQARPPLRLRSRRKTHSLLPPGRDPHGHRRLLRGQAAQQPQRPGHRHRGPHLVLRPRLQQPLGRGHRSAGAGTQIHLSPGSPNGRKLVHSTDDP